MSESELGAVIFYPMLNISHILLSDFKLNVIYCAFINIEKNFFVINPLDHSEICGMELELRLQKCSLFILHVDFVFFSFASPFRSWRGWDCCAGGWTVLSSFAR